MTEDQKLSEQDKTFMRRTFELAADARDEGIHPFSAILVDGEGNILMEQVNGYLPDLDMTGHAERVLMTRASKAYRPDFLKTCTMYVSAEPCAMCAGSAYWAGLGRLVYSLSEHSLKQITGNHPENPTLDLPCRTVFESGQREVEIIGPVMEEEGAKLHEGFWD
ncbi:MAG: tRNA-specific adenosine deaminase [Oceanospirillaceae bacterium]|uniref:nucleoside deaminase n=1 Tax=unclassified Thalassolituus TaxID=2624967 RepID=UPI000C4737AF|nr:MULTISPECIES: nucleoside deaminase [unclassified Thalassolituus]MAY01174.1 tRNA-specific adenosine deaminase [Oceanospirillaceae bacterium]MBL35810.1 tRNA-specific adenosine deaminase [Oceanospirillaceae bacterium]|tara:strand:+ start:156 stop:647 length:492 start_codon:yes stop_codon:yes gene_type:complete